MNIANLTLTLGFFCADVDDERLAMRNEDRRERLAVAPDDPTARAVAHDPHLAGLSGSAIFDLCVDPLRVGAFEQLLFERLPVGGVVDVRGDVAVGRAKAPIEAVAVDAGRRRMAQARGHSPPRRRTTVH